MVGAVGVSIVALCAYGSPRIRLASPAELRAVCPPELLATPAADEAAQTRFKLLVEICRSIEVPRSSGSPDAPKSVPSGTQTDRLNENLVAAAMKVLAQGPIQRPYTDDPWAIESDYTPIKQLAKILVYQAELAGQKGDRTACARAVLDSLKLSRAYRSATGSVTFYGVSTVVESIAEKCALGCCRRGWLSESAMREIIREIPELGPTDSTFTNAVVQEFQRSLGEISRIVLAFQKAKGFPSKDDLPGSFDATATARLWVRYFTALRQDTLRDWRHQDSLPTRIAFEAGAGLPKDPDPTSVWSRLSSAAQSVEQPSEEPKKPPFWTNWIYAFRINSIPNSFGRFFVSERDISEFHSKMPAYRSTRNEITKAVIALRLYSRSHQGNLPSSLSSLVAEGFLGSMPMDWFACAPLRYDSKRRLVYSIGPSGVDHGGWFKAELSISQEDFGAFIDQPKESPLKS